MFEYKKIHVSLFSLIFSSSYALAGNQMLEDALIDSMRLKHESESVERLGDSGKAIRAYMKAGVVNNRPNTRLDYTDYYLLNKQETFMGHQLIIIEQEYMTGYIGCCVSPGVGVTVLANGSIENMKRFAKANGCSLTEGIDIQKSVKQLGVNIGPQRGSFVALSCRDRDAELSE